MTTCNSCGADNLNRAKFCMECGARLAKAGGASQERKVITVLFCDLVGFTALSETTDHEDVDAMLSTYADCARALIEGHGGTVEKFIGDAVVGVFGVPAAHEDDAERAVRAGLKISTEVPGLSWSGDVPLCVRVGINTGESFVHLDISPDSGRTFITGDVVNTAARLQNVAEPGAVVVGELTAGLSRRSVLYEELEPVTVKGKICSAPRVARP